MIDDSIVIDGVTVYPPGFEPNQENLLVSVKSNCNGVTTYELSRNDEPEGNYGFYLFKFHDIDKIYVREEDVDFINNTKYCPIIARGKLIIKESYRYCPLEFCDKEFENYLNNYELVVKDYLNEIITEIDKKFKKFSIGEFEDFANEIQKKVNDRIVEKIL